MKKVYAICGAGGKTTLCKSLAKHFASKNEKVCVLTTTHMWHDEKLSDINKINRVMAGQVYYFGTEDGPKVAFVSDKDYDLICKKFDYIVIEADGSKSMPLKIPMKGKEPVIPKNTTDIIIVAGLQSVGRELSSVCFRFNELSKGDKFLEKKKYKADTIVTKKVITDFIDHYYIDAFKTDFPKARFYTCLVDMAKMGNYKKIHKVALSLCASGASKRFGVENKLLAKVNGKVLYKLMADKLLATKKIVLDRFKKELSYDDIEIDIAIVSKYEEILNDDSYRNSVVMIKNDNAEVGLSNSIKLTVNEFKDYDAIMFLNSDLPNLPVEELSNFLYNSICSNTGISSMYTDMHKNPAYFENIYFDEILTIDGDKGPKDILDKYKMKTYKYHINSKYLVDIDTKDDLNKIMDMI